LNDPSHAHAWRTPLALAVLLGNADAVRVLLEHHADQTVRDPGGHTLLEIARENGNELIIELLRRDER
jgi:ankyrin repeat protein